MADLSLAQHLGTSSAVIGIAVGCALSLFGRPEGRASLFKTLEASGCSFGWANGLAFLIDFLMLGVVMPISATFVLQTATWSEILLAVAGFRVFITSGVLLNLNSRPAGT